MCLYLHGLWTKVGKSLKRQTRATNFGDRAFSAAGTRVWNYLPTDLRQPDLLCSCFRQSLETFLFSHCEAPLNYVLEILSYLLSSRTAV